VCDLPLVTEIRLNGNGGSQGNNLWLQTVHGETQQIGSTSLPASSSEEDDKGAATSSEGDGGELNLPRQLYMPVSDIEASAKYRHGSQIWIGGDEIIAIVDTGKEELAKLSDCRSIRFRSILMGNDSVLWGGYGDAPSELPKLGSNERHLHFYYALDYAPLSGKTHYRYKLNSDKWSVWSEKQNVEFLNLPHGSYTLSVQAQLANGELSDVASIEFSIAYPLLLRWYMFVVYGLLLIVIVNMLFRYRLKRLKKDKLKLEHIIEERTSDLRNAQSELIRQEKMATVGKLTEGLIDRILNPMNYIINFSKMSNDLLKDLKENIDNNQENIDKDDYEDTIDILGMLSVNLQNVDKYGQNTTRTLKAMEEMLKDRTGGYVAMDWLPVLRQNQEMMDNYFAKEKEQYHIQTSFSLPDHPMPLHGNPEMLSKTVMSLLGNAVYAVVKKCQKDTPGPNEGGYVPEISLSVTLSPSEGPADKYILKIRDNGTGIGEKTISKVFDPFFTTKTTAEAAGVGLYLSREIIQNHGGDISVASVKDTFTEFTITLPIKK
jgi:signal transduction histidine kinase